MSRYMYADHILEAFNVFHRPMAIDEVATYVAEMEAKSVEEVRLAVDNTVTAAWMHGFLAKDDRNYTLACGYWDEEDSRSVRGDKKHPSSSTGIRG